MKLGELSKKSFVIIGSVLFLLLAGIVAYLLIKDPLKILSPKLNRYEELISLCDTEIAGHSLTVSCNGLLTEIRNQNENCFDMLIISKDKNLEKLSLCEDSTTLTYDNSILNYKLLMPIEITLNYDKTLSFNEYFLKTITLVNLSSIYTQDIVNSDLSEVLNIRKDSTTILNSFDFCPNPNVLPTYITNKNQYSEYWDANITNEDIYTAGWNYSLDDATINLLFACQSASNIGNSDLCKKEASITEGISNNSTELNSSIDASEEFTDIQRRILKELSLIYDNMFLKDTYVTITGNAVFDKVINQVENKNVPSEILCSSYQIYERLDNNANMEYIRVELFNNIDKPLSGICNNVLEPYVDPVGLYLKNYFSSSTDEFKLLNRCMNLTSFFNNDYEK